MMYFDYRIFSARFLIVFFWITAFSLFFFSSLFFQHSSDTVLYVFSWPGVLDPAYIQKFEKETGIKVKINYYESNQELLTKLKATKGGGYDLLIPSDYTVNILRKESLLEPLNREKLTFFNRLHPSLLNHYYDKNNIYSVPFDWGIYGIGVDTTQFPHGLPAASWKTIFEPENNPYLAMVNDPYEAFDLAKISLYGNLEKLNQEQIEQVTNVLKKQHPFVTVYTDARADYLLATHNCSLAVSSSTYMWRGMKKYPYLHFIIPQEGTILTVENFVMLKASTHKDAAYAFLNFIYSKESIQHHFNYSAFLPATIDALDWHHLPEDKRKLLVPTTDEFKKFHFLQQFMPEQELYELWITVKS